MKTKVFLMTVALATGLVFTSCRKDDESAKPVVNLTELGHENTKVGHPGKDLHVEANIEAEGKIDKVRIMIHPEGDHDHNKSLFHENEWEVDTTYTEFSGLKNTTFHKHIDISANAEVGHYHFHFTVTDKEGQQTTVEEELEIKVEEI